MSVKNTGNKPTHFRQYVTLGPKPKVNYAEGVGPEPGSDEDIMISVSKRYESGAGFGDRERPLCTVVIDEELCIHSIPCPLHLMESEENERSAD